MKTYRRGRLLDKKGFTLIEILIVMLIIAIGTLSYIYLQKNSWTGVNRSNKTLLAGQILERHIESVRTEISLNPNADFPSKIDAKVTASPISDSGGIKIYWTKIDSGWTNAYEVELKAKWFSGKPDSLVVRTCIAKNF